MIAPMKKITLLTLDSEREKAVKALRKLGLVHVESKSSESKSVTELKMLQNRLALCQSVLNDASKKAVENNNKKGSSTVSNLSDEQALTLVDEVIGLSEKRKENLREIAKINTKIKEYAVFGDFNPSDFQYLEERNVTVALCSANEKQYRGLFEQGAVVKGIEKSELDVIKLGVDKKKVLFLLVGIGTGLPASIDSSITVLPIPEYSREEYVRQVNTLYNEDQNIAKKLLELSENIPALKAFSQLVQKRVEFETVYTGMESHDLSEKEALATLTGYIPTKDFKALQACATENSWGLLSDEPSTDDAVPTKLEGNAITKTIHPLFDFLNTYPGYFEPDVSWTVLFFFGIFVAIIFGDAGYGSLVFLGSVALAIKTKLSGKTVGVGLRLFMYLSIMTIIWGTLSCSWFGISPELLPEVFRSIAIPGISGMVDQNVQNNNVMLVSFTIGAVHLIIAHLLAIFTNKVTLKTLGEVGSIMMLTGMYFVVLNILQIPVGSFGIIPIATWMLVSIGAGFVINFVFCNYEGSIGGSIIASLKDIITKILGVVNVFSDIMSYVRLWAVGLAGASIMMTVNDMVGPMLSTALLFAVGVIICVFGHGLNMVLNVLSVLVHAVRLNTMEFAGHAGLGLTGFKYNPFRE